MPAKKAKNIDEEEQKAQLKESIEKTQGELKSMLEQIDDPSMNDLIPSDDILPGLNLEIEVHDYNRDIELLKIETRETLECIANLYLDDVVMQNKNIHSVIKDDASLLCDLKFAMDVAKRGLIACSKQIDMGVNDPDMHASLTMYIKEIRDVTKMAYDLQKKMKDFYKEMKGELSEINAGTEEKNNNIEFTNLTTIGDPKLLNDIFDRFKNDPTLLEKYIKQGYLEDDDLQKK